MSSPRVAFPAVDDRLAQVEAEGALADDEDGRALQPLVDRAAHPAEGVFHDGAEAVEVCLSYTVRPWGSGMNRAGSSARCSNGATSSDGARRRSASSVTIGAITE